MTSARVMSLGPGEPAAGPWEAVAVADLVAHIRRATGDPAGRPAVVAVDGRSGAGKSTLARRLAAAVGAAVVVHTDDVAWNQSFFDWHGPLAENVLEPVRANRPVTWRPRAWVEHARPGAIEVPAGRDWVVVEGVGAGRRDLAHLADAVVWVQSDTQEAEQRALERDVAEGTAADTRRARVFWDEWMAEEVPFLERERPWDRACCTVAGTEVIDHTPDQVVVSRTWTRAPRILTVLTVTAEQTGVRDATADDGEACAAIYAPYVTDTAITFETEPPSAAEMARRIAAAQHRHAWLVLQDGGRVVGYAYGGLYKERPAYRWSCEVSIYLERGRTRTGGGRRLYDALFRRLADRGFRTVVAGMALPNDASVGLHDAMGFRTIGTWRAIGFKGGAWHDVAWAQKAIGAGTDPPAELV